MHPIVRLAQAQHGCVTDAQLAAHGVSPAGVQQRLRAAQWLPILPHAFYLGVGPQVPARSRAHAVLLTVPSPVRFTGNLAAAAYGLAPADPAADVVALVPREAMGRRGRGIRVVRSAMSLRRGTTRDGLPLVTEAAALVHRAHALDPRECEAAVEAYLRQHRDGSVRLRAACGRGVQGSAAVTRALGRVDDGHWSRPERVLAEALRAFGETDFEVNVEVCDDLTGELLTSLDLLWRRRCKVVEVDGWRVHSGRAQFRRDRRRDLWLRTELGLDVLRIDAADVLAHPRAVAAQIVRWLSDAPAPSR